MKIMEKIDTLRNKVLSGEIDADKLATAGIEAMFTGMQRPLGTPTDKWVKLMNYITTDARELDRLCGKEPAFNRSRWGLACIAYIAGNSTCTSETTLATGTRRAFSLEMVKNLDAEATDLANFNDTNTDAAFTEAFKN